MTQKQKAEAYDKAFEIAKNIHRFSSNIAEIKRMEELFPELKESEDERVRKELLNYCKNRAEKYPNDPKYKNISAWIAWLEKQDEQKPTDEMIESLRTEYEKGRADAIREMQGEQKHADKVEPKFKVGDWCIDNEDGTIFQIVKVLDNTYTYKTNEGKEYSCTHYSLENDARLWTIQDAKDGDVLAEDKISGYPSPFIAIFKTKDSVDTFSSHCFIGFNGNFYEGEVGHCSENLHPATKEERDILFEGMADAGYTFNFEKKELKKIAQKFQRIVAAEAKEALYDKIVVSKDTIRLIIELFISWNGETEAIDVANLPTAVDYINEYLNEN